MRILVDAHMSGCHEAGNETYVVGLLAGFDALYRDQDPDEIVALVGPHYASAKTYANVSLVSLRSSHDFRRVFIDIPRHARDFAADVVHATYHASFLHRLPLVVSVHDVIHRIYPGHFSVRDRLLLSALLPLTMARAAAVVTLSQTSKRDILRYYPSVHGKVSVVPIAAGPVVGVDPDYQDARRYHHDRPFILAVGRLDPRKNIAGLVRAYGLARERRMTSARLIIAGPYGALPSSILSTVRASAWAGDVVFTGFIDEPTLAALYRTCQVFVYPSLYEGFGLPVLEAMACGAPVITSNVSALPEVAGDAAVLVDPSSSEELCRAIGAIAGDRVRQDELRDAGLKRAGRFSWQRTAALMREVYSAAALGLRPGQTDAS